jgi:hypothetical protein
MLIAILTARKPPCALLSWQPAENGSSFSNTPEETEFLAPHQAPALAKAGKAVDPQQAMLAGRVLQPGKADKIPGRRSGSDRRGVARPGGMKGR